VQRLATAPVLSPPPLPLPIPAQSRFGLGGIHDVTLSGITARAENGVLLSGRDGGWVTGVTFSDVNLTVWRNPAADFNATWAQHDFRPMDAGAATPNTVPALVDGVFAEGNVTASVGGGEGTGLSVTFQRPSQPYWDADGGGGGGVVCVNVTAGAVVAGWQQVGCGEV
jgi:hypothetical protein